MNAIIAHRKRKVAIRRLKELTTDLASALLFAATIYIFIALIYVIN